MAVKVAQMEKVPKYLNKDTGDAEYQEGTEGFSHHSDGIIGLSRDRYASAPGTTQGVFSWTVGYGPKKVRVRLRDGTTGDVVKFVFDAPTIAAADAVATLWLADVGSATTDRMHRNITNVDSADANTPGDEGWSEWIKFTAQLVSVHYVGVGTLGAGTIFELEGE